MKFIKEVIGILLGLGAFLGLRFLLFLADYKGGKK